MECTSHNSLQMCVGKDLNYNCDQLESNMTNATQKPKTNK